MDFDKLFELFTEEAFRLETLPVYDVLEEKEAIIEYKETGKVINNIDKEWIDLLKIGKPVKRLRLLSNPLSDYENFELEVYKSNTANGEDIRAMNRDLFNEYLQDFWIFDMKWIGIMKYDKHGKFLDMDFHEARKEEIEMAKRWKTLFETAIGVENFGKNNNKRN